MSGEPSSSSPSPSSPPTPPPPSKLLQSSSPASDCSDIIIISRGQRRERCQQQAAKPVTEKTPFLFPFPFLSLLSFFYLQSFFCQSPYLFVYSFTLFCNFSPPFFQTEVQDKNIRRSGSGSSSIFVQKPTLTSFSLIYLLPLFLYYSFCLK